MREGRKQGPTDWIWGTPMAHLGTRGRQHGGVGPGDRAELGTSMRQAQPAHCFLANPEPLGGPGKAPGSRRARLRSRHETGACRGDPSAKRAGGMGAVFREQTSRKLGLGLRWEVDDSLVVIFQLGEQSDVGQTAITGAGQQCFALSCSAVANRVPGASTHCSDPHCFDDQWSPEGLFSQDLRLVL